MAKIRSETWRSVTSEERRNVRKTGVRIILRNVSWLGGEKVNAIPGFS
jgi:hypothetical protein